MNTVILKPKTELSNSGEVENVGTAWPVLWPVLGHNSGHCMAQLKSLLGHSSTQAIIVAQSFKSTV